MYHRHSMPLLCEKSKSTLSGENVLVWYEIQLQI